MTSGLSSSVAVDGSPPPPVPSRPQGGQHALHALSRLLGDAGVTLNGPAAHDPRVRANGEDELWRRLRSRGLTGLGEAYVDGLWDCDDLPELFRRLFRVDLPARLTPDPYAIARYLRQRLGNRQRRRWARWDIAAHYDRQRRLFQAMLDPRMAYSCGYWSWPDGTRAPDLAAAQEAKLDLVCRKLDLRPGLRLLDIGCGWGSLVKFAAEHYGVRCHGITLSAEQRTYAAESCANLPVEIELRDYRDLPQQAEYDRIVSIGMFEHVGPRNYGTFFDTVRRVLRPDGLMLLHFFATNRRQPSLKDSEVFWIERHIFPGLLVPDLGRTTLALQSRGLVVEDLHNFGPDYEPTLLAWEGNFRRNWTEDASLRALFGGGGGEADRFYRLWRYYLFICAAAFESRKYHLLQLVLSPGGVRGGYRSVR